MSRRYSSRQEKDWTLNPMNLLGFVGLVSLSLGMLILLFYLYDSRQWSDSEVTTGTISTIHQQSGNQRDVAFTYLVADENGIPVRYTNNQTTSDDRFQIVGQSVEIQYFADDPETSRLKDVSTLPSQTSTGGAVLCCGGWLLFLVPMGLAVSRRI